MGFASLLVVTMDFGSLFGMTGVFVLLFVVYIVFASFSFILSIHSLSF
jgi:hypothetical protein